MTTFGKLISLILLFLGCFTVVGFYAFIYPVGIFMMLSPKKKKKVLALLFKEEKTGKETQWSGTSHSVKR